MPGPLRTLSAPTAICARHVVFAIWVGVMKASVAAGVWLMSLALARTIRLTKADSPRTVPRQGTTSMRCWPTLAGRHLSRTLNSLSPVSRLGDACEATTKLFTSSSTRVTPTGSVATA